MSKSIHNQNNEYEYNSFTIEKRYILNAIEFKILNDFTKKYVYEVKVNSFEEGYEYCIAKIQELMNKEIIKLEEEISEFLSDF